MKYSSLAGILAASGLALASLVAAEMLTNPGFETGDWTGWSTFGQGWRIAGGEDANSGEYGAVNDVLAGDMDEWRGIFQNLPARPGLSYSAGVYIRAVNILSSASWFELQWLDAEGNVLEQLQSPWVTTDQPFTYRGVEGVMAPPGAVAASVRGIVQRSAPPADEADFHIFDNFRFVSKP